jgi:molybdate transport system substrate-binding protein
MRFLLACLILLVTAPFAHAGEVRVAVASNFAGTMQKLAAAFEHDTGHKAVLALGSTGRFYTQVRNGAPFDVLLAADDDTPARLEKAGLAVAGSRFTYATGRLVLWSASVAVVDTRGDILRNGDFTRIAIADPKLAPYGAAAMQAIERLGLTASLKPRLVQGESIGQAYQFVATGSALLGFVALSQVWVDHRLIGGSAWLVPRELHEPIRQDAALLKHGADNPAASALMQFLRSDKARAIIRAHGYES